MSTQDFRRKLTAVFSADVAGYGRLMGEDEAATVKTLEAYKQIMFSLIKQHRGRVVDSPGDNLLAEFASVVDAVQCGVAVQKELQARNADLPENRKMQFRIGINLGDVIEEGDRIYGDGVNIASRLEALAEPGGMCISKTAFDHIESKLPLGYQFLGEQRVKNIAKPIAAYKVLMEPRIIDKEQEVEVEEGRPDKPPLSLPDKPSIAVLPFVNMSGDPEQEYFSDGITEEIITGLSKVPRLFVIARNSTFTYKGKPIKVQQVGRELGVKYVLEGSVRKAEDKVRITAQLVDAQTGHHLWADRYDRKFKEIFALQDEITLRILIAMQVKLTEGEQANLYGKGTDNLEAYLKLLQGRQYIDSLNRENIALAQQVLGEAIALDPGYAEPYTYLAVAHFLDTALGFSKSPLNSMANAIDLAQKAIALDDSEANPHSILGLLLAWKGEYEKGVSEAERAIELNPNSADARARFAMTLNFAETRREEAIVSFQQALRLNPIPPVYYLVHMGLAYAMAERYEEALAVSEKAVLRQPNNVMARIFLAAIYGLAGRAEEAHLEAAEVIRISPNFSLEYASNTWPIRSQVAKDRFLEALRKAGLK
jgi:adenylate cyclase